jgi:hypothetical protein
MGFDRAVAEAVGADPVSSHPLLGVTRNDKVQPVR